MNDEFSNNGTTGEVITQSTISDKSKLVAALLAFFLGTFGIHRFYLGRYGSGVVLLLLDIIGWATVGIIIGIPLLIVAVIWNIIDFIRIICNGLGDSQGRKLK